MKDYAKAFQKKIAEINADADKINIINAGVMNHGKSSLFNSLIGDAVFPEEDVRTTVKTQIEEWSKGVYLIDTPGLSAEFVDDAVAYEAYRRANVILFVHRVDTGELHKNGIDGINKIKSLFPDEKFFTEHFCLVLTSIDDQSARENLETIRDKALADIKKFCGLSGFKVFFVSNTRYRKGLAERKSTLLKKSGIPELHDYLQQNFSKWLAENKSVRIARIAREKEDFISQLRSERSKVQSRIKSKQEKIRRRQKNFLHKLEEAVSLYNSDKSEYEYQDSVLDSLNDEFVSLTQRWQKEHY
ncbi:MAG: 50S ribosome-binding GTPase [Selenomonadaceae bacterium]|nr:50S ribosome-binding GTPase [Selenomonadaceae bacterium]